MNIQLISPSSEYLESYRGACILFRANHIPFGEDPDQYETWRHTLIQRLQNEKNGIFPEEESWKVPASTYWLVDSDSKT